MFPAYRKPSQLSPNQFRFLNVEREITTASNWNDPQWDKLWLYNLHYFDDLNTENSGAHVAWQRELIQRWLTENPPAKGNGWEPYPLSLRIVNWIKWVLAGNPLPSEAVHSLAIQCRYLNRRLEWHLLGNHLFANAKAMVFCGLFFEGKEADEWLQKGLRILAGEVPEQVLADGGHFERSPMYHSIILEDLLDLLNITSAYPGVSPEYGVHLRDDWHERVPGMLRWLRAMCHPDGQITFFNDAAFEIAPEPSELERYAVRLGMQETEHVGKDSTIELLGASGYVSAKLGAVALIFDGAPVGPDYIPGHAHADTLSFELSWHGQRVVCNSGTSCYGLGARRTWERSTAAHNAVAVDGQDSSEVWSGFRVARRARPLGLRAERVGDTLRLRCGHDGYGRLSGKPIHYRTIEISDQEVVWRDEVSGRGNHRLIGYIPIHPEVVVEQMETCQWHLKLPSGQSLILSSASGLEFSRQDGWYSPEFGKSVRRPVVTWQLEGKLPLAAAFRIREIAN